MNDAELYEQLTRMFSHFQGCRLNAEEQKNEQHIKKFSGYTEACLYAMKRINFGRGAIGDQSNRRKGNDMMLIDYSIQPLQAGDRYKWDLETWDYLLRIPKEEGGLTQDQMKALIYIVSELKLVEDPDTMGVIVKCLKMEEGDGK